MLLRIYGCCETADGEDFSVLPSELWLSNADTPIIGDVVHSEKSHPNGLGFITFSAEWDGVSDGDCEELSFRKVKNLLSSGKITEVTNAGAPDEATEQRGMMITSIALESDAGKIFIVPQSTYDGVYRVFIWEGER